MITCMVIDDQQHCIDLIKNYVGRLSDLQLLGSCTSPVEGIGMVKTLRPDLVFLDIEMPEMNGIDVMKQVEQLTSIIFCTAHAQFAVDSYELDAADYLLKPILFDRFVKAVDKAMKKSRPVIDNGIFVKAGVRGKLTRIGFDEIDYIKAMDNYVLVFCGSRRIIAQVRISILEQLLPGNRFIRVHKSYIVAFKAIGSMASNEISLQNSSKEIPVSLTYREKVLEKLRRG